MSEPTGGVRIRTAVPADVPEIVRLLAEDALGQAREQVGAVSTADYDEAFAAIEADPRNEVVVAVQDGRVVGCMQLTTIPGLTYRGGTRLQVEGVRVDRTLRSAGIGTALLRHAIAAAEEQGCQLLQLTTNAERTDAHRFYERLGFQPTHVGFKLHLPRG